MGDDKQPELSTKQKVFLWIFLPVYVAGVFIFLTYEVINASKYREPATDISIQLASMDFTVINITENHLTAKWDSSIRLPETLTAGYVCLQGDLQASFLYKNVTLATSSPQKYYNIHWGLPQLLKVSTNVSEKDISGLIGKDIMKDIKEKREVQFVSRFFLTDCRKDTTGVLSYACDEVTLRFEPGPEMKASLFRNHPSCINF